MNELVQKLISLMEGREYMWDLYDETIIIRLSNGDFPELPAVVFLILEFDKCGWLLDISKEDGECVERNKAEFINLKEALEAHCLGRIEQWTERLEKLHENR